MEQITYCIDYKGNRFMQWHIKNYLVSFNNGKWLCSCAIKYKRNPNIECKHIRICKKSLINKVTILDHITKEIYGQSDEKDSLRAKFQVWNRIKEKIIVDFEEFAQRTIAK